MTPRVTENTPEALLKALDGLDADFKAARTAQEEAFKAMQTKFAEQATVAELNETVTKGFAEATAKVQDIGLALNDLKKQIDNPLYGTNSEVADAERKAAVEHERALFNATNTDPTVTYDERKCDLAKYHNIKTATRKLITASDENDYRHKWGKLSTEEQKALSMSQIDGSYFLPEVQQVIRDCFLEPIGLFDLYDTFTVSKMTFMYPFIKQHTALGGYVCSDDCGTIQAANVNLHFRQEQVYDWRGTFCVTTRTLADSAIDLLALMAREMALSKRMTSNQAWINGDGVKQPKGWLANNLFPVVKSSSPGVFTAADVRSFLYRVPPEYGNITAVMHPNTLAVIMSMTNSYGEFLFGEGMLFADPSAVADRIRLSRYMPEIQWTVTPGSATTAAQIAAPANSLVCAAANWKKAYMVPTLLPMMMRQGFMIQGPWCAQYHFWAQDGGAGVCGEAGRVLQIA